MTQAFIQDHVRTLRGKGKKDGGLHQASAVWLLRTLLQAMQQRNALDTRLVDDLVLGCVTPVGEQGADIARTAVLNAGWAQTVAGVTLSRLCASGLEAVNLAAAQVMSGMEDLVVAGGVESMSRWPMGSDGGAWVMDPRINQAMGFTPQGIGADLIATLAGWGRADVDAFAVRSHQLAAIARAEGRFERSIVPVFDIAVSRVNARHCLPNKRVLWALHGWDSAKGDNDKWIRHEATQIQPCSNRQCGLRRRAAGDVGITARASHGRRCGPGAGSAKQLFQVPRRRQEKGWPVLQGVGRQIQGQS